MPLHEETHSPVVAPFFPFGIYEPAPAREKQKDVLFAAAGFLYSGRYGWQTAMAERLHVDARTLRRWISGQDAINPTAWELIKMLVASATPGEIRHEEKLYASLSEIRKRFTDFLESGGKNQNAVSALDSLAHIIVGLLRSGSAEEISAVICAVQDIISLFTDPSHSELTDELHMTCKLLDIAIKQTS